MWGGYTVLSEQLITLNNKFRRLTWSAASGGAPYIPGRSPGFSAQGYGRSGIVLKGFGPFRTDSSFFVGAELCRGVPHGTVDRSRLHNRLTVMGLYWGIH